MDKALKEISCSIGKFEKRLLDNKLFPVKAMYPKKSNSIFEVGKRVKLLTKLAVNQSIANTLVELLTDKSGKCGLIM